MRVVILGAGFAGLSAALELERSCGDTPGVEITLVDQHNYHLFQPLLYQVVTGGIEPGHISFPVRSLIRGKRIEFRESRATGIDLRGKTVATDDGDLPWDRLVIALGSTTNYFGLAGEEGGALPLKTLGDSVAIHNRLVDSYEAALREGDGRRRRRLLSFVVVGGGATGVELAASIQDFVRKVMPRDYPTIPAGEVRVFLLEARGAIIAGMDPKLQDVALKRLGSMGVEVMLDTPVAGFGPEGVRTAGGLSIPAHTVVWVAGVKPVSLVEGLPLDRAPDGRILVDRNLGVPGQEGVYIAGDCAYLLQEGRDQGRTGPFPPTGQIAVRQGLACAQNIARDLRGEPRQPLRYRYRGELISMGRNAAVAQVGGWAFDGLAAWLLWRIYYLGKLTGFRNKLSVALDWSFAYFYRRNTARLG